MCFDADGCPNGCGTHGTCRLFHVGWACTCMEGWKGTACEVAMETTCNSGTDDDGGHLSTCRFRFSNISQFDITLSQC